MSEITEEQVRHVGLLSRLNLSDEEVKHFTTDLKNILHHVDTLSELDTQGIEPTSHALKLVNVFREDDIRTSLTNDEALMNAPDSEDGCFKVPAVLQEEGAGA